MRPSLRRTASAVAAIAVLLVWVVALRPQRLGGTTEYLAVRGVSMLPTMHNGDLVVVERQSSYRRGEIIAYRVPRSEAGAGTQIIHRIVGGDGRRGFVTRGDNNPAPDTWWHPRTSDIIGRVWLRIPRGADLLGSLRSPFGLALVTAVLGFTTAWWAMKPRPEVTAESEGG